MSNHERDFVNNFLTLACLEEPALPNDYSKPLEELNHLGLSLQPLNYKFDNKRVKLSTADHEENEVELTLKSIRAPKFTMTKVFAGNDLVLQVKDYLRKTENALDDKSEIKLLLKGKVLNDGTLLSDLNSSKAVLTVMISQGGRSSSISTMNSGASPSLRDVNPSQNLQSLDGSTSESQAEKDIESALFNDMPWEKIDALLKAHFGDLSISEAALNRLKRGWELAK